ncbi:MAG TPA: class I SAM-dependent methyltransferase [Vicinamibacterales bacterium]|nr:class I SAM-dependent methyltransferase [Vicinamibacterales bacterium]
MEPPREVIEYYEQYPEESRLQHGAGPLEFERTKIILSAVLPPAPARVLDVGGAAGAYSAWLAGQGFDVHLVDASARLVGEARRRNATLSRPMASLTVADARALPAADGSAAALLLMGPLYHLTAAADRAAALREALRVLAPAGSTATTADVPGTSPPRTCITPTSSGTRSRPLDSNRSPCMVSKGRPGWWATSTASGRIPPCAVTSCTWRPRSNVNQA